MRTIPEVRAALTKLVRDESRMKILSARVVLRTGVNLSDPRADHLGDPAAARRVLDALREMGFDLRAV